MESVNQKQKKLDKAITRELLVVESKEQKLVKKMEQAAVKAEGNTWKNQLERKIPTKVYSGLESAFCKGFMRQH